MSVQTIITGQVLEAKVANFKDDDGVQIDYGKVQLLIPDMSGDFYAIQNIKVKTDKFGVLADLKPFIGKRARVECSTNSYNGKTSYYLEKVVKS